MLAVQIVPLAKLDRIGRVRVMCVDRVHVQKLIIGRDCLWCDIMLGVANGRMRITDAGMLLVSNSGD